MQSSKSGRSEPQPDLLRSQKFKLNLESYCRLIFTELIRTQKSDVVSPLGHIRAYTFWQYSKLPKLISDRLYGAFAHSKGLTCLDFIMCFYTMLSVDQSEKISLVFKMADFNSNGQVNLEDLHSLLNHCSALSQNKRFRENSDPTLQFPFKSIPELALNKFKRPEFKALMENTGWHHSILGFILSSLNIVQKVHNFSKLKLGKEKIEQNASINDPLEQIQECSTQEEQNLAKDKRTEDDQSICEGVMYRMVEDRGLRPYYYKLINSEVFSFRSQDDHELKKVVYYGHDSYLLGFKTQMKTSKSSSQIYCLEADSSGCKTQYFMTNVQEYEKWKIALLSVMGLPGFFNEDFQLFEEIGQGEFGTVSKATNLKSGKTVAIKAINKLKLSHSSSKLLREEIEIHALCSHPNLVKLYSVYEDDQNVYQEMEYVKGGSLSQYISRRGPVSNWFIIGVLHQVAKALQFLKKLNIMHRDVKSQNILLTGKFIRFQDLVTEAEYEIPEVKLADYGLSTIIQNNEKPSQFCGSCGYMAPQVFLSNQYDYSADVYSLGVVAYQLCTQSLPFKFTNKQTFKMKIINQRPNFQSDSFGNLPSHLGTLIRKMLSKVPELRPSLSDIIQPGQFLFPVYSSTSSVETKAS